jgi:O-antigen/teichoic acid export membrane protein
MLEFIQKSEEEFYKIFSRLKKRDFSGNEGQAIKNSTFQLSSTLLAKLGSLVFTIIIARLLMPELFGLYSLALATILLISSLSDFGISTALITFVSKSLEKKNNSKAKAYFKELIKYKFYLVILGSVILILSSYFISHFYYNKPIFLALLAGALYLPIVNLSGFFETAFKSSNDFKIPFFKEILFQIFKLTLIPFGIFLLLKLNLLTEFLVMSIIILLTICYSLSFIFLICFSKKKLNYLNLDSKNLTFSEKKELRFFLYPLIATTLSGVFLGYVDTILLGHFVEEKFIGYYSSAFSLIGAASSILGFIGAAIFPIFARLKGKNLNIAFKKTINLTFLISLFGAIFSLIFANFIIKIAYGYAYESSVILLQIFSILLIIMPICSIYEIYFLSQEKSKALAKLLVFAAILNVILNYVFIIYFLKFGMFYALIGSCIAVISSRLVYLISLKIFKKKLFPKS